MMRVLVVVEGTSEELFLRRVLAEHLANRGVYLTAMKVLRGHGARGGGSSWQVWRRHLRGLLGREPRTGVAVTTFLDLYRIPDDTPGYVPPSGDGAVRADQVLQALRSELNDERFIPYIQVHEFESLLFAELMALSRIDPDLFEARELNKLATSVSHLLPEAIDEGDASAPSKRVLHTFPKFDKIDHGVPAVEAIGLTLLREKCPRFNAWVTQLEALGTTQL